jgi:NadR type nicotinamide-nucleotide adenylyltransferase
MEPSGMRKIAIVGAECTGKSVLTEALAKAYNCPFVTEFAREYLGKLKQSYTALDVQAIARGQLSLEDEAVASAEAPYLFCDTNLWVIKVWMDNSYKVTPEWIEREIQQRPYHLHIVTDYNIPYETDSLREHPNQRAHFTDIYRNLLDANNVPYIYVQGGLKERIKQVITSLQ